HLAQRLLRCRELGAQAAQACGEALREGAAVDRAAAEAAASVSAGTAGGGPGPVLGAQLVDAGLHRLELLGSRAWDVSLEPERLPAGLELRDDLGDDALLVLCEKRQSRRHLRDVCERGHLLRGRLPERQLRAR